MSNTTLFSTRKTPTTLPATDTLNNENVPAYEFRAEHALAQYALTGTLHNTFYARADIQLERILALSKQVSTTYLADLALHARTRGFMKDCPALLLAIVAKRSTSELERVFFQVIDNVKMLRNFVQIIRSGQVGSRSFGSATKKLIERWLVMRSSEALFRQSAGNKPSFVDVIRMIHPKPETPERNAFYGYLLGKPYQHRHLPKLVREYESFKAGKRKQPPAIDFQLLSHLKLDESQWQGIAKNAGWQTTRMNLNTFLRHGVFNDRGLVHIIANRLRDPELIAHAKVFPYQLMATYKSADSSLPHEVQDALHDALELSLQNLPKLPGKVVVCTDISGSMQDPITGYRKGSTSKIRCVDVAALVSAAILRLNPDAQIIPFEEKVQSVRLEPRDSVFTNADRLAALPSGGTNCSAALTYLNQNNINADLVIFLSDNESWVDARDAKGTEMLLQWNTLSRRCPKAKLVCIDLTPNETSQVPNRQDILNIGGFSDNVFKVIDAFARSARGADWVSQIQQQSDSESEEVCDA